MYIHSAEDVSVSGSDADVQLLEAAKTGDLEVVKVCFNELDLSYS